MSLLVDAQKKAQQAQQAARPEDGGLSLEALPDTFDTSSKTAAIANEQQARQNGQNLFAAKSAAPAARTLPNRNLLLTLGGTVLLLVAGGAYLWWSLNSPTHSALLPAAGAARAAAPVNVPAETVAPAPGDTIELLADTNKPGEHKVQDTPAASPKKVPTPSRQASRAAPSDEQRRVLITPKKVETQLDPLLGDAYAAYQRGDLDAAQQHYSAMLQKDPRNIDTLLGLAAIAQRRADDRTAAQYYSQVLTLAPRNAVAYAGMASLGNTGENQESVLKTLLREQSNSAALHTELGNLYADQSRWAEAQQAYFNAYNLQPDNAGILFNLAISLDHLGQARLAAQHYRRALQLDPSHTAGFDHENITQRLQTLTP
ncbi:MAG: tetratricopeptide repeat protein [Pseudomonadota bacterium]